MAAAVRSSGCHTSGKSTAHSLMISSIGRAVLSVDHEKRPAPLPSASQGSSTAPFGSMSILVNCPHSGFHIRTVPSLPSDMSWLPSGL
jgi:hypothetical protein